MIYGIFDKSYLLEYSTNECHLAVPEDIKFVNFRRINGYLIRLLQELNDLIVEEYLEKNRYSREHALLEAKKTLVVWSRSPDDAQEICNNYRSIFIKLCQLLEIPKGEEVKPLSLYRFFIYDPEYSSSGMMWLMKPDIEEEVLDGENLGVDGKPLTSGDRLLDLEIQVRLGLGESFDPSLFERYNPIQLEYMGRLVGRINEKTSYEAKAETDEVNTDEAETELVASEPLSEEVKAILATNNIPMPLLDF